MPYGGYGEVGHAVELAVREVEDYPFYKTVGYGGLPNENCEVELDAAYMDGDNLSIGAVAGIKDFANPVSIARKLSYEKANNFLVGLGAEEYAHKNGFERKNMLTERAKLEYIKRKKETLDKGICPYTEHDTVGMICLDEKGKMCAATSTSGLFMKKKGRMFMKDLSKKVVTIVLLVNFSMFSMCLGAFGFSSDTHQYTTTRGIEICNQVIKEAKSLYKIGRASCRERV